MQGVYFGEKHSFKDFGLILTSKIIALPEVKSNYIDIPGSDGTLDLTEAITNDVMYKNRKLQFTFSVINYRKQWESVKSNIAKCIHGKSMKIILDCDRTFYYLGRVFIDSFQEDKRIGKIVISVDAEPYKYDVSLSTDEWKWDDFNFYNGIIYNLKNLNCSPETVITIPIRRKMTMPIITSAEETSAVLNGESVLIEQGSKTYPEYYFRQGENTLKIIDGTSSLTIEFRGGEL